jgi:hypothetical protein
MAVWQTWSVTTPTDEVTVSVPVAPILHGA